MSMISRGRLDSNTQLTSMVAMRIDHALVSRISRSERECTLPITIKHRLTIF